MFLGHWILEIRYWEIRKLGHWEIGSLEIGSLEIGYWKLDIRSFSLSTTRKSGIATTDIVASGFNPMNANGNMFYKKSVSCREARAQRTVRNKSFKSVF
jgi:hypothetical protein